MKKSVKRAYYLAYPGLKFRPFSRQEQICCGKDGKTAGRGQVINWYIGLSGDHTESNTDYGLLIYKEENGVISGNGSNQNVCSPAVNLCTFKKKEQDIHKTTDYTDSVNIFKTEK